MHIAETPKKYILTYTYFQSAVAASIFMLQPQNSLGSAYEF